MPRHLRLLCLLLLLAQPLRGQVSFWEDSFAGGITGGGYTPDFSGGGLGNFTLDIAPGSTIRKAWLFAGRHGFALSQVVTLNGINLTFNNANQVSPNFATFYTTPGGTAGVHAIEVTSLINPAINNYSLFVPVVAGPSDRFQEYYLYVAYDNPALPPVTAAVFLNTNDFLNSTMPWNCTTVNPITNTTQVGISVMAGYMCNNVGDGEFVTINGTAVGMLGGNDINSGACGGPVGSFGYRNNTLTGLSDDIADQAMNGSDALSECSALFPATSNNFTVEFTHQSASLDNSVWMLSIVWGGGNPCPLPVANAGADVTICEGSSANLSASGGTTYAWTPAIGLSNPGIPNPVASPLFTTTYNVTVTDSCGSSTDQVVVTVEAQPVANAGPDLSLCEGQSVTLSGSGGGTYSWSPAAGLSNPAISTPVASPVVTTVYDLTVTNNCGSDNDQVTVTVNPLPLADAGPDQSVCENDTVTLSGTAGGSVSWSPASSLSGAGTTTPQAFPDATTTYTLTVTGAGNCTRSDQVTVTVHPRPVISAGPDLAICEGAAALLGASFAHTWQWNTGETTQTIVAGNTLTQDYWVTGWLGPCQGNTDTVRVSVSPLPVADFSASPTQGFYPLAVQFTQNSQNFSTVTWHFGDGHPGTHEFNPVHTYTWADTFYASLMVWNELGCGDTLTREIIVNAPGQLFIPNAFTPNGDGINDLLLIGGMDIAHFEMDIYDRWGMWIFHQSSLQESWDGTLKGQQVPEGVYVLKIRYSLRYDENHLRDLGVTVNVIR